MQRKTHLSDGQRGGDLDSLLAAQRNGLTRTNFGPGRCQTGNGSRGELSEVRLAVGEVIIEQRQFTPAFDNASALEEIEHAYPNDL